MNDLEDIRYLHDLKSRTPTELERIRLENIIMKLSQRMNDTSRLDWFEQRQVSWRNSISDVKPYVGVECPFTVRQAIDIAMRGKQ